MTRVRLLALATFLAGAGLVHAQNGQVYYGNGYTPNMAQSYAPNMAQGYYGQPQHAQGYYGQPQYPQGYYGQPVQRMQYPYYGNQPRPYTPAPMYYPAARQSYPTNPYSYGNGYGVNYYWQQNPVGFSPTPAPYSAVANNRAIGQPTIIQDPTLPLESDLLPDTTASYPQPPGDAIDRPYHRKCNERVWVSADYVGMFLRPMRLSGPLLTTGAPPPAPFPGALGQLSTSVLVGNQNVDYGLMSGLRLETGLFLDGENHFSIELAGFWLLPGEREMNFASDPNGNPVLARPVFNIAEMREGAFVNSLPNTVRGTFSSTFQSQMGGVEINARYHDYIRDRLHVDGLFGFRYLRLREQLKILENITGIQPGFLTFRGAAINAGDMLVDDDSFRTTNQFFGPQIGGRLNWEHDWLTMTAFAKLGVGVTTQQTQIAGTTTLVSQGGIDVAQGGILALPSNIGTYSRTSFGLLPEFGINMGVELTQCMRLKFGYSVLLWNHVIRPGAQFDRTINPGQTPGNPGFGVVTGPAAPIYRFNDELFWTHSFNVGMEFHF